MCLSIGMESIGHLSKAIVQQWRVTKSHTPASHRCSTKTKLLDRVSSDVFMATEGGFRSRLQKTVRLIDLLAILVVPGVLLLLYALPTTTRESLVFTIHAPTLDSAYTTHFVHLSIRHLTGNLAIYVLVVPASYLLAVLGDCRRIFFIPYVAVLLSFPFVLSGLHLALGSSGRVVGFSGINMAFVGMVPLFQTVYLSRLEGDVRLAHAPTLFFAGTAVIAFRVVPPGQAQWTLTLGAALVMLAYIAYTWRGVTIDTIRDLLSQSGRFELVVGSAAMFFIATFFGFPSDPKLSNRIVDVYTHFLGYSVGFVSAYFLFWVDDPTFRIPPPPEGELE